MLACRPNVNSNGICPVVSCTEVLYPMHINFKFSSQSFCRSVVQVRIRSFTTACVRSRDPLDCGWKEVVFMCRILKALSNVSINLHTKFRPMSVRILFGLSSDGALVFVSRCGVYLSVLLIRYDFRVVSFVFVRYRSLLADLIQILI
ncbi:uncharacterized protein LOC117237455 [Bombus vosnesenskii]|uniref:Uncharacterized protein LOC117237455 n=1 Tax=Bombus vosnesenskii TaxID=207650 RepID=A0A6J3KVB3_9HYME|nr:uncharacterized protein LOC117237455 [Bombus vosnesenskii]